MGCVETYLSGPSLEKYWVELGGKPLSLEEIIESFEHNPNVEYLKWRKEYLANFGMALSNDNRNRASWPKITSADTQ